MYSSAFVRDLRRQETRAAIRARWIAPLLASAVVFCTADARAQQPRGGEGAPAHDAAVAAIAVDPPAGFVLGPDDVLSVVFWRDKEMSTQVTVRPDGKISLPLLNEVQAAGLTPATLREQLAVLAKPYFEHPTVTVVVNQINSRKVFITGQIGKPGSYPLTGPTTVLQLISMAGGLKDFADSRNILIVRHLRQNIELKPGDTVVVP
jgi:polysaccharide biosynthesis/export protein